MPPDSRFVPLEVNRTPTPIMIKHFTSFFSKFLSVVILLSLLSFASQAQAIPEDAASITAGQALFNGNCKSCHKIQGQSVGPGLAGVYDRTPSIDWILAWVKNPQKVIASGDEYANKIYLEYKKSQMTAFTNFKDEQILAILGYIKSEANKPTTTRGSGGTNRRNRVRSWSARHFLNLPERHPHWDGYHSYIISSDPGFPRFVPEAFSGSEKSNGRG
jgi:mono/diheme cytochrome c family protein